MINVGVLDLYRRLPGALPAAQWRDIQVATDTAAVMMLALQTDPDVVADDSHRRPAGWSEISLVGRAEVHQATGMVLAQMEISARDALARIRAHAFLTGCLLIDVADDIVQRRLSFAADGEPRARSSGSDPGSV